MMVYMSAGVYFTHETVSSLLFMIGAIMFVSSDIILVIYIFVCTKQLFGTTRRHKVSATLPFSMPELRTQCNANYKISISGAQPKFSLRTNKGQLQITDYGGTFLLKPAIRGIFNAADEMPANEHVSMQIARQVFGLQTADCAFMQFSDGLNAYITKRFDVKPSGERILQEDFAQVAGLTPGQNGSNYKYDFSYEILEDGIKVRDGKLDVDLAAARSKNVTLGNLLPENAQKDAEYFIRFSVRQREATDWAEAGYEVASEQFCLRRAVEKQVYPFAQGLLSVSETATTYTVSGDSFEVTFSKSTGLLTTYTYGGVKMITNNLRFNAFRVPTDNDGSHKTEWDNMGLRNLTSKAGAWNVSKEDGAVTLTVSNTYTGSNSTKFTTEMSYRILPDGAIIVGSIIDPEQKGSILPKMGYTFEMPEGFEQFTWYGRGPWENYRDRKECCHVGLYHSSVTDQWTGYVLPQENGNHEEVRFISLTNEAGQGLMVVAPELMSSSVGHWRAKEMYTNRDNRKKHPYEVTFIKNSVVNIDAATRGLGNNSCGPDVLSKYELKAERTNFSFILLPLTEPLTDSQLVKKGRIANPQCQPVSASYNKGRVTLSTTTTGATIRYSTDGGNTYSNYTSSFAFASGGTITAVCEKAGMAPSQPATYTFDMYINKTAWKVYNVSSEQGGNEAARNAIDGNPSTFWHTRYSGDTPKHPHTIIIDMGKAYNITHFIYQARNDGSQNGRIANYELYFSNSPTSWKTTPDLKGSFVNNGSEQAVALSKTTSARYFKLVALSEVNGNAWASAAELSIRALSNDAVSMKSIRNNPKFNIIYDIQGKLIANADESTLQALPQGMYIINRQKILVK